MLIIFIIVRKRMKSLLIKMRDVEELNRRNYWKKEKFDLILKDQINKQNKKE